MCRIDKIPRQRGGGVARGAAARADAGVAGAAGAADARTAARAPRAPAARAAARAAPHRHCAPRCCPTVTTR